MAKANLKTPSKVLKAPRSSNPFTASSVTLKGPVKGESTMKGKKPGHKKVTMVGPRTAGKVG